MGRSEPLETHPRCRRQHRVTTADVINLESRAATAILGELDGRLREYDSQAFIISEISLTTPRAGVLKERERMGSKP